MAGIDGMQTRENLEQRRLAASGRPHQRHELAGLHVEGCLRDGKERHALRAVGLLYAGEMDEWFGLHPHHASRASRGTSARSSASTSP